MKIHILGICGTFMAGIAVLAKQLGHDVSGTDRSFYQPMLGQLDDAKIKYYEGFDTSCNERDADLYIIGNVVTRDNKFMQSIIAQNKKFISGPQWLNENVLNKCKKVISVTGTHGKTTTTSMLIHILNKLHKEPSYLIGGKPSVNQNSANFGNDDYFVLEADEYDTAFFDKRPKFIHYWSDIFIVNNIEFDHADIYNDLSEIKKQFKLLKRNLKHDGKIIVNSNDEIIYEIYTHDEHYELIKFDEQVLQNNKVQLPPGDHNLQNFLAAFVTCINLGLNSEKIITAMNDYQLPARRMQEIFNNDKYLVYDDFAHHPTAIKHTLTTLAAEHPEDRLIAIFEPRSNTMKAGHWQDELANSFLSADFIYVYAKDITWDIAKSFNELKDKVFIFDDITKLEEQLVASLKTNDVLALLSNGDFANLRKTLVENLNKLS